MDILHNNSVINEIVDKLFKHRRSQYSEFALDHSLTLRDIQHQILRVPNRNYETLYASLFKHSDHPSPQLCILFMHGYGSNRLECANLLKSIPEQWALCSFDFSGCGKSEGDLITYGMKEKEDINSMMVRLRKLGFSRFVLWGRSMGATSALLYSLTYRPDDVVLQVIDSPFFSFEMIAFQIASKNVKAPQFVISFALQLAKKNCGKFQYNPFDIELKDVGQCEIPALFVYCQEDTVINSQNIHLICSKYRAVFEKLVIAENHNTPRTNGTLDKIFDVIKKYSKKPKPKSSQDINGHYFNSPPQSRISSTPSKKLLINKQPSADLSSQKGSLRKGIQRVNVENKKRFDDYGIWASIQTTQTVITQENNTKKKSGSLQRPHLSLSSSFAAKHMRQIESVLSPPFHQQFSRQPSSYPFSAKLSTSQKEKRCKKISTVKSLANSQSLNNCKYL